MTKKIKIILITACMCIGIAIGAMVLVNKLGPQTKQYDYPYFTSETQLTKRADLIVLGEVLSVREESIRIVFNEEQSPNDYADYVVSTVKITQVLKGDAAPGDTIEVKQIAGNEENVMQGGGYYKEGESKALFLMKFDNAPYSVLNPLQGQYAVVEGRVTPTCSANTLFLPAGTRAAAATAGMPVEEFVSKVEECLN